MKIVITGSEGYIAKYLIERLKDAHKTLLIDKKIGIDITANMSSQYCFCPDIVFHLAAWTSAPESFNFPNETFLNNVMGTENVLKFGGKIIFASTAMVYGDRLLAKENDIPAPQSPYATSKLAAEQCIQHSGLPYVILRLGNVYGRESNKGVIKALKEGGKIFGDGRNTRDYVHVDDVVDAMVQAMDWSSGAYNIGTGRATSVLEIADILKVKKQFAPAIPEKQKFVSLDCSMARTVGWTPKKILELSINE
jgi:UDP-glucose 4-epimerase